MIKGLVQGVGFRPFVYRVANKFRLKGEVENRNDGVIIEIEGVESAINEFVNDIRHNAPPASYIESIHVSPVGIKSFKGFSIIPSTNISDEITLISPDIAVCKDCLDDMRSQQHRLDYPFINCTNCGPRFTIIKNLPYDRVNTTMDMFPMCDTCRAEYSDVLDRRFHAQPVACHSCGPVYTLNEKSVKIEKLALILRRLQELLDDDGIIAIKGVGGYFLACDALSTKAVEKLRKLKNREGKPFAVMFADEQALKEYTFTDEYELQAVKSWQRPIVLLGKKNDLAWSVTKGFPTIGAMLPYMPFHYLMFENIRQKVLVLTSGNFSDEPIFIDDEKALEKFLPDCEAVLSYNREIYNRVDDSIVHVVNQKARLIRRSRGYVPVPIKLEQNADGIVAAGAELVNCFCLGKGNMAFLSQHIGDLKNMETYLFYIESFNRFKDLFRVEPKLFVADLHPDYLSTRFADQSGLPVLKVQHHHAHIASCMAEHGLDEKVIGVAFDGVGLGDDGKIWGGEFFISDLSGYDRLTHFEYQQMPGGDKATLNPWRMAVSYLYSIYGESLMDLDLPFLHQVQEEELNVVIQMLEKNFNCPETSSAGRLFDAVAGLTGLCLFSDFHAEAPMRLEGAIKGRSDEMYNMDSGEIINVKPMIRQIVTDIQKNVPGSEISLKFHNTIVDIIQKIVNSVSKETGLKKVVLSGGTFQNRYISEKIEIKLQLSGLEVYMNEKIPCNDGGIALGQLAIATKKRGQV